MLNALAIEVPQMTDLSMVYVEPAGVKEHHSGEQTVVGKNTISSGVLRPGVQNFVSPLALRYALDGGFEIRTERGRYEISPTTFVMLNERQAVEQTVEAESVPQAFTLMFDAKYLADIAHTLNHSQAVALEIDEANEEIRFPECIQHESALAIGPKFRTLAAACRRGESDESIADRFRDVCESLVQVYSVANQRIEAIDSVRPGTRAELYRRIQRAYICIQDNYSADLCLEKIARVACMSPHHFHRVFSQVYGITPLRALADRRMQMAHKLLETTDTPVAAICHAVGYHSAPTFSNLFRAKFGVPPSLLQQRSRRVRAL